MRCSAQTKRGTPCKANALKDTDPPVCMAHSDEEVQESAGFGGAQPGSGRPRKPTSIDFLREWFQEHEGALLDTLTEALTAQRGVVVGNGPSAELEMVPDHETRLRAFREALDRFYGRPRQAVEVTGEDGGPIQTSGIDLSGLSVEELRALRELLGKAGA